MNNFDYEDSTWSTKRLYEIYKSNQIKLDLSFQRYACWPDSAKKSYITSIFNGVHPGTLIIADVLSNRPRADYFENCEKDGYRYISIDGNNRSVCISEFYNNKFKVKVNNKLKFYRDLSTDEQVTFDSKKLNVINYHNITKKGCADVFVAHNQSEKLGAQEYRNARIGKLSDYVRNYELKLRDKLKNFKSNNSKRKNDEFILDAICQQLSNNITNKKTRDYFWEDNLDDFKFNVKYLEETFVLLKDVLNYDYGDRSHEALARDFLLFRGMISRYKNLKWTSNKDLVDAFSRERKKLWLSTTKWDLKGGEEAQYSAISGKPAEKKYYKVRIQIMKDLVYGLYAEGILYKIEDRDIDTSDLSLRKKLYDRQNGKCPRTKKGITDFWDTKKYHTDHVIPLAKGGKDDISNMELTDRSYNLKKGSKLAKELNEENWFPYVS